MPLFRYEALDSTGNSVVGAMQVTDEQELSARLAAQGYRTVSVHIAQRSLKQAQAVSPAYSARPAGSALVADERSVARMLHQLHISFRAGMPAYQAITTVAAQVHHGPTRQALAEIGEGVRQGQTISGLMERYPRIFTAGDVGMIRAAELAGFLPEAFGYLAKLHEEDDNTHRRMRIWQWFFHSQMFGLFLLLPMCILLKEAIPKLDIAAGVGPALQCLAFVSVPLSIAYAVGLVWFNRARRDPRFAFGWHKLLLKFPVSAKINRLRANAVFTRTLQQIYKAGVAPSTAWETASGAVPNLFLGSQFLGGKPVVDQTQRLSAGMQQCGLMDPTDIGMIATGEATGEIPQALDFLANHYEEETKVALGASVVRGALTFTAYGFIVGGIAIAFFAWCYGQGALGILKGE